MPLHGGQHPPLGTSACGMRRASTVVPLPGALRVPILLRGESRLRPQSPQHPRPRPSEEGADGLILLDVERCRGMEMSIREQPEYTSRWMRTNRWLVCPECLWLSVWPVDWPAGCGRPPGEPIRYGGGFQFTPAVCCQLFPESRSIPVPQAIVESIWSTLLIGGTNAVLALLWDIQPDAFGLPTSTEKWRQRRDIRGTVLGKGHAG